VTESPFFSSSAWKEVMAVEHEQQMVVVVVVVW
jgi:hypothetical protein